MKIRGLYPRHGGFWTDYYVNGKRLWHNLGTKDPQEAIVRLAEFKGQKKAERGNLKDSLDWALGKVARDTTRISYASVAKILAQHFGSQRSISSIGEKDVTLLFEKWKKELSGASAQSYVATSSALWGKLKKEGKVGSNPWAKIKRTKTIRKGGRNFLTRKQRDEMISTAIEPLKTCLMLGFFCGFRRREIIEARRDWLDFANSTVVVLKAEGKRVRSGEKPFSIKDNEEREIPMHPRLKKHLLPQCKKLDPLDFVVLPKCKFGKSVYRYDFRAPFEKLVKQLKLHRTTIQTMRRTFASLLVQGGHSITEVAYWLGDDERIVRSHYAYLDPKRSDISDL
jgi:integrase